MPEPEDTTISEADAIRALERFVVENDDLVDLETKIGRFNIFDALGIVNAEIRHSKFLAWLLDPNESHGSGSIFLRTVLMNLFRDSPPDARPISPIELDGDDLGEVEIRREWRNIDILIILHDQQVVVVIENKIKSSEHSNQLARYRAAIKAELAEFKSYFVYLTPDGDEPSEDDWNSYSYANIHSTLTRCRELYADSLGSEVDVFLEHYLSLIGSRLMQSEKINALVDKIYKNHRQALNLIYERRGEPRTAFMSHCEGTLLDKDHWHIFRASGGTLSFVPTRWLKWMPALRPNKIEHPWIYAELSANPNRVILMMIVAPSTQPKTREVLVNRIKQHGARVGLKINRKKPTTDWTRIYSSIIARDTGGLDFGDESLLNKATVSIAKLQDKLDDMEIFIREALDEGSRQQLAEEETKS